LKENRTPHLAVNSKVAGGLRLKNLTKKLVPSLPLISVITVTLNAEEYIEETICSVLTQDYPNVEYIIIDGCSKDKTIEIIQKYENQIDLWISEKDRNIYDGMNKGLKLASGDYISFLNASDYYCDRSVLSSLFKKSTQAGVVYGDIYIIDYNAPPFLQKAKDFSRENLNKFATRTVNHQAIFVKNTMAVPYNIRYRIKAELNWYYDILDKMDNKRDSQYVDIPVVFYRRGGYGDKIFWPQLLEFIIINYRRGGLRCVGLNLRNYFQSVVYHYNLNLVVRKLLGLPFLIIRYLNEYSFFHFIFKNLKKFLLLLGIKFTKENA
jgi:glycosyltransferase involved in cell wall biosynthesis